MAGSGARDHQSWITHVVSRVWFRCLIAPGIDVCLMRRYTISGCHHGHCKVLPPVRRLFTVDHCTSVRSDAIQPRFSDYSENVVDHGRLAIYTTDSQPDQVASGGFSGHVLFFSAPIRADFKKKFKKSAICLVFLDCSPCD